LPILGSEGISQAMVFNDIRAVLDFGNYFRCKSLAKVAGHALPAWILGTAHLPVKESNGVLALLSVVQELTAKSCYIYLFAVSYTYSQCAIGTGFCRN